MKPVLTIKRLITDSKIFCEMMTEENHKELTGVTDGKAIGTYVEHRFQSYLSSKYSFETGNSAKGIDLPGNSVNTDIKVTSVSQPQSSCPFKNARQKIFGLGYNLLIFVYEKNDSISECRMNFKYCTFINSERTADYTISKRLIEMVKDGACKEDIIAFLQDRNIPGDEIIFNNLAEEILKNPPVQGYLTISNALQWRLQYSRVITLDNSVNGITNYVW